jgi:hypothetical protein
MNNRRYLRGLSLFIGAFAICTETYAAPDKASLAWENPVEIVSGQGQKGPWKQNESRYDYVDDPSPAVNENGEIFFAWADQHKKDVFMQRIGQDGSLQFHRPVNVSGSPKTFSWLPKLALSRDGLEIVFVVWQEIIFSGATHGGEIFFARSDNGGKTFSAPLNISQSFGGDGKGRINKDIWHNGSYDMVVGPQGSLHIVWTEYDGALWIANSSDAGGSFSKPVQVAGTGKQPARGPSIAIDQKSTIYLAWTTGEKQAADILVAHSADGGKSFSKPVAIEPNASFSDAPKLNVDSKGMLHLAYAESDGDPFGRYQVRYARSAKGIFGFEKSRVVSDFLPASQTIAAFPSMAIDAGDNIFLMWELFPKHNEPPKGLAITVSRNAGHSFSAPSIIPHSTPVDGTNGSQQGLLMKKLNVNSEGFIGVGNSSLTPGMGSRVWLMRGRLTSEAP